MSSETQIIRLLRAQAQKAPEFGMAGMASPTFDAAPPDATPEELELDKTRKVPHYQSLENAAVAYGAVEASRECGQVTIGKLNAETGKKYGAALDALSAKYPFVILKTGQDRSKGKPITW